MKKYGLIMSSMLFSLQCLSDGKKVESKITAVTVFLQGAQITRNADLLLQKGVAEIIFDKLPTGIDDNSLQVTVPDRAKILSVTFRINDHKNENDTGKIVTLQKQIQDLNFEIQRLKKLYEAFGVEESLLLNNTAFSGNESGVNLEVLKQAADYFRKRMEEIGIARLSLEKQKSGVLSEINDITETIKELKSVRPEPTGEVIAKIEIDQSGTYSIMVSYFLPDAGWYPDYDIRISTISEPIVLSVKANVFQKTGEDWNDVGLILSTNNPRKGNDKPELLKWNLGLNNTRSSGYFSHYNSGALKGKIIDSQSNEPIPFANVILELNGSSYGGATSDFEGNYIIKPIPPGQYNLMVTYVGYNTHYVKGIRINRDQIRFYDVTMESSSEQLGEVIVTDFAIPLTNKDETLSGGQITFEESGNIPLRGTNEVASMVGGVNTIDENSGNWRGSRSESEIKEIEGIKQLQSENYISNASNYTPTNINYHVKVPYSIPSDGENYSVKIFDYKIPTEYEYYCAPKIEQDVFLVARLNNWGEMNLISGQASIFFEGTYTGKTYLNTANTDDTLKISVGRDNNIIVKRKQIKNFSSVQLIGSNKEVSKGYEIEVRNNKNAEIRLILEDQIPISENNEIVVKKIDFSDEYFDEKTGKLTWTIDIKPQESITKEFRYSVKFPKVKNVILD